VPADSASHPLRAVALFLAALLLFSGLDATAKHLSQTFTVPMLVWARYTVHCLVMVVFLAPGMGMRLLATRRPLVQVVRGLMLVATTAFCMAAFQRMPLAETTALVFITPLVVTLLAVPLLKEQVPPARWIAVATGFAGALLVARPGGALSGIGVLFALLAALAYGIYQILTRQIAGREHPVVMLFYTALIGMLLMTLGLPWFWSGPMPDLPQALLIASLGLYGGTGHFLLIRAFRMAPASLLSPFLYVQLVWATLLGWLVFGHVPDVLALAGMAVIGGSGLWIALAERRRLAGSRA
jgi:drug/metabolite transporter (DMT)-like permease